MHSLPAVAYAVGVVVTLEVGYFFLRRTAPRLRLRWLYHTWALVVGGTAYLVRSGVGETRLGLWNWCVGAALVLTALVVFAMLEALVLVRPWDASRGPMMPELARDALRLLVLVGVGLVAARAVFDQPLQPLLVSSTALLAVVGFALQDVLKNIFAGMALQIEKPFQVGDWLLLDGQPAQVLDMSWRTTQLRTNDGVEIFEPNSSMSAQRLVRLGSGRPPVAFNFEVGLPYRTPPARARRALLEAARGSQGTVESPPPEVFLASFADSAILYRLRVWTSQVGQVSRFRDSVQGRIWYQLQRAGIEVPFPMRTVLLHDQESRAARVESEERRQVAALLGRLPLFHELHGEALERLAAAARRQHYERGERLVREGETGDSLFVIEAGGVRVAKSDASLDGTVIELARLGAGDFFGEMSLLTGEPRSATVTAEEGCEVLMLSRQAVQPVLAADPSIAETLSRALAARAAETEAKLEDRRATTRAAPAASIESSILRRIRSFFKLGEE
jgi:small-conductance mechanosensitive channel/CRP-like cAMP-binding protein